MIRSRSCACLTATILLLGIASPGTGEPLVSTCSTSVFPDRFPLDTAPDRDSEEPERDRDRKLFAEVKPLQAEEVDVRRLFDSAVESDGFPSLTIATPKKNDLAIDIFTDFDEPIHLEAADGDAIRSLGLSERFGNAFREWTSRIAIGARYLEGNSNQNAVDVAVDLEKKEERHNTQINLGGQFGQSKSTVAANRWFANTTTDFYRGDHWLVFLRGLDQYDQLQNLDYRGTVSVGPGYRFFDDLQRRFIVRMGPGMTAELFHKPSDRRFTPDLFGEVEVRWPLWERLKWEQKTSVFPSVSNLEVARALSQTSFFYAFDESERWSLRLGFLFQYNSEPAKGRVPTDYTTNLSVVYQRK